MFDQSIAASLIGRTLRRVGLDGEISLADQPVVEAEAAHHRARAVIAHDDRDDVVRQDIQERADLLIHEPVVVAERRLVLVARLVERVGGIPVLPEHVVEAIRRDLTQHEEVPRLLDRQLAPDPEASLGHLEHLVQCDVVSRPTEVRDVEDVVVALSELADDLGLELGGIGPGLGRGRGQEASDPPSGERPRRRERRRNADQQRSHPFGAEHVPDRGLLHGVGRRDRQSLVAGVLAVAKAVDPQLTGRLAGHRARPGGDRDRRRDARQVPPHPALHQRVDVRRFGGEVAEQQLGRRTVQPDHRDPLRVGHERVPVLVTEREPGGLPRTCYQRAGAIGPATCEDAPP